ncbi:MAG TPA: sulfatase [Sphingomonas sp.]|nr:sulfatase [Sphingomonas sp.]
MARAGDTRRSMLRKALLGAGAAMAYAGGVLPDVAIAAGLGKAPSGKRPDIVIFIADDLSWTDIGPNGSKDARTPNIDRLAREGTRFARAFAASPTCTPSRSALLTGDYPMRNGAHANHSNIFDTVRTMPAYLKALGYRVVVAGKTDFGPPRDFPFEYLPGSTIHPDGKKRQALLSRLDTQVVDELFATRDPETPLALFVASFQPHVPWAKTPTYDPAALTLPENFVDTPQMREDFARYLTDVTDLDRELGEVRGSIAKHGKADDTLFVFTVDHGAQLPFAKWTLYDPGIHIPLIAAWPGRVPAGRSTEAMVSLTDVLPTMLEAAGAPSPQGIDGKSFLPVLTGEEDTFRDHVFAAHTGDKHFNRSPMRAIRTDRWKLIVNLNSSEPYINAMTNAKESRAFWASWVEQAKTDARAAELVNRYQHRPPLELYDIVADPYELHNLADDPAHAQTLATLKARIGQWRIAQGEKLTDVPMPEDARFGTHFYADWR